jgi:hypothetical protein
MAMQLGGAGPVPEPPQKPMERPAVPIVGPETADFQPGRNAEAMGSASPANKKG